MGNKMAQFSSTVLKRKSSAEAVAENLDLRSEIVKERASLQIIRSMEVPLKCRQTGERWPMTGTPSHMAWCPGHRPSFACLATFERHLHTSDSLKTCAFLHNFTSQVKIFSHRFSGAFSL